MRKTNIKIVHLLISLMFTVQIALIPSVAFAWVKSDGFGADTYNTVMTAIYGEGESPYGGSSSQVYGTGSGSTSDDYEDDETSEGNSYSNHKAEPKIDWIRVAAQIRQELETTNTLSPLLEGLALQMGYVRVRLG